MNLKPPTGLDAISGTLTRGSTGDQVKALQQYLIGMGYTNIKPDGVYGPITEAAVKELQSEIGVASDGKFGPATKARATQIGSSSETPTKIKTQDEIDAEYSAEAAKNPTLARNSPEALSYAISSGDMSGLLNEYGKPFSKADQDAALSSAEDMDSQYWQEQQQKDTGDTESALKQQQLDYENWLATQGTQFAEDKTGLDQKAADQGVLFSGGRAQKEQTLADTYSRNAEYKRQTTSGNIGDVARDFQSKYGDQATKGLSSYYKLGSNTYNPKVATGGVSTGGLSSVYNPNQTSYYGSERTKKKASDLKTAAGLLWNKGNKLVGTGIKNQYQ